MKPSTEVQNTTTVVLQPNTIFSHVHEKTPLFPCFPLHISSLSLQFPIDFGPSHKLPQGSDDLHSKVQLHGFMCSDVI